MNKKITFAISLFSLLSLCQARWTGNVNILGASKQFDKDKWAPIEQQPEGGIGFDFKPTPSWPVSLVAEAMVATGKYDYYSDNIKYFKVESQVSEVHLGARWNWEHWEHLRLFAEGGFSGGMIEIKRTRTSDSETSTIKKSGYGGWGGAGLYWTLWRHWNFGGFLMASKHDVDFETLNEAGDVGKTKVPLGGGHVGLFAGFHW